MSYQEIIEQIAKEVQSTPIQGKVADYIPELSKVQPEKFGVHFCMISGEEQTYGDSLEPFSIQSISKVLSLTMAFKLMGERLWKRVGVEPSGTPFNSLIQLEYERGIPRNPLINSGAMVICDILMDYYDNPLMAFIDFVRDLSGDTSVNYNEKVAKSEMEHGFRNAALIHLMKSFGNINHPVEKVLEFYFYQCALEMNCKQLATTFLLYAGHGKHPVTKNEIISVSNIKRINAIMQTCGFYDESGDYTFRVGLPGKSGVGGGIAAVYPGSFSVAVWSPCLNSKGNSVRGINFLEDFTTRAKASIF
jgi:glutaminase